MTTITDKLEAALPANDDDNGPVTLPASVVRGAILNIQFWRDEAVARKERIRDWEASYDAGQLALSDQRNAKGLAWTLAVIGAFVAGAVVF